MTQNVGLTDKLKALADMKALSGQYELQDDTITADILDAKSDAMLKSIHEDMIKNISEERWNELPPRAKILLQELAQLYCRLYYEVNVEAPPAFFTALFQKLKRNLPLVSLSAINMGLLAYTLKRTSSSAAYAVLGELIAGLLGLTGLQLIDGTFMEIPEKANQTLLRIREIENMLKTYGITFQNVNVGIPYYNR